MTDPMIETERLLLREYTPDDFDALHEIMSDPETMQHYPAPFDEARTRRWIEWNIENYAQYGFGLWAVILKETGAFIGDCGITIQNIDGEMLPEIGYHIHKQYWRRGFAKEAARAVRDWVFQHTEYDTVYSYMKYTNIGSWSTALANGMRKVKEYPDPKNTVSYAFAITRREWETLKKVTIRKIEEKDYPAVAAIWREVLDIPTATDSIVTETYKKMKADSGYRTYVAETDGKVVGLAATAFVLAIGHPNGYIKMNGLGVLPEYQHQGIGRLLLNRVEKLARECGALYIGLASGLRRTEAHDFYEHLGYQKTSYWFRKNLE